MGFMFRHRIGMAVLIGLLGIVQAHAIRISDTTVTRQYPYAEFSSNTPSAGERISVKWLLGMHPNSCVPLYETTITKTMKDNTIRYHLEYQERVVYYHDPLVCDEAFTPYGPEFILGPLESGYDYQIYVDTILIREFSLDKSRYPYAIIRPSEPKAGDTVEVQWVLGQDTVNCVPQYSTTISLSSVLESYPPIFMYDVEYKEIEVDYLVCLPRPTIYGPTFRIPTTEAGTCVLSHNGETLTRFTVSSGSTMEPVMRAYPDQPTEGDSLKLELIIGRGSRTCKHEFITEFDSTVEADGRYLFNLKYTSVENNDTGCVTMDLAPYGPTWTFPDMKPGYYIFFYGDDRYFKVYVEKKRTVPQFPYAKIWGTVREDGIVLDNPQDDAALIVPQCTVAVVFNNTINIRLDENNTTEGIPPPTQAVTYTAITDANGHYTIDSIPSALLTDRAYLVARKNGMAGFRALPDELTENMVLNITVQSLETFIDTIRIIVPEPSEVVTLLRELGIEKQISVTTNKAATIIRAAVMTAPGGFRLVNPSAQNVSAAAFSMNGRKLWSSDAGRLAKGTHLFTLPRTAQGIVLIRVRGENFQQSKVLSLRRN